MPGRVEQRSATRPRTPFRARPSLSEDRSPELRGRSARVAVMWAAAPDSARNQMLADFAPARRLSQRRCPATPPGTEVTEPSSSPLRSTPPYETQERPVTPEKFAGAPGRCSSPPQRLKSASSAGRDFALETHAKETPWPRRRDAESEWPEPSEHGDLGCGAPQREGVGSWARRGGGTDTPSSLPGPGWGRGGGRWKKLGVPDALQGTGPRGRGAEGPSPGPQPARGEAQVWRLWAGRGQSPWGARHIGGQNGTSPNLREHGSGSLGRGLRTLLEHRWLGVGLRLSKTPLQKPERPAPQKPQNSEEINECRGSRPVRAALSRWPELATQRRTSQRQEGTAGFLHTGFCSNCWKRHLVPIREVASVQMASTAPSTCELVQTSGVRFCGDLLEVTMQEELEAEAPDPSTCLGLPSSQWVRLGGSSLRGTELAAWVTDRAAGWVWTQLGSAGPAGRTLEA
ncbi:uncharacterized protein LOC121032422 [Herpailurus yagouaroundi]|uniref:uncharacterized protein LOC121032422 n=1 Tax=Herpailurus yagouaroundi TaxID=1608482 RepID=UPI001AD773DC|nr:uncharacterized protein LOC121032422 [Puma yagouaroundi]